ncbi:hypothetical protein MAR_031098 [Mya arenaria]|uniref:Maturase K n=1 Tax=Mya arenaria TaxID=6604 RepID=A0ABY7F6S9_MYAAR|nr:hypothetical protein MAR_031098 [Mya arenaria]
MRVWMNFEHFTYIARFDLLRRLVICSSEGGSSRNSSDHGDDRSTVRVLKYISEICDYDLFKEIK